MEKSDDFIILTRKEAFEIARMEFDIDAEKMASGNYLSYDELLVDKLHEATLKKGRI
jgi:hypothetical protein